MRPSHLAIYVGLVAALSYAAVHSATFAAGHDTWACAALEIGEESIGVFWGNASAPSPLSLRPLEAHGVDGPAAWPLANPVLSPRQLAAGAGAAHFGGVSAVTSPHLVAAGGRLVAFYEAGSCSGRRAGVGAAESADGGATWADLGLVLGPGGPGFVRRPSAFEHGGAWWLAAEAPAGGVRLFRAAAFPTRWALNRTVLPGVALRGASLARDPASGSWLLAGSAARPPVGRAPARGERDLLDVWVSGSPLGGWRRAAGAPYAAAAASPGGGLAALGGRLARLGRRCAPRGGCGGVEAFWVGLEAAAGGGLRYTQRPAELSVGGVAAGEAFPAPKPAAWDSGGHTAAHLAELPGGRVVAAAAGARAPHAALLARALRVGGDAAAAAAAAALAALAGPPLAARAARAWARRNGARRRLFGGGGGGLMLSATPPRPARASPRPSPGTPLSKSRRAAERGARARRRRGAALLAAAAAAAGAAAAARAAARVGAPFFEAARPALVGGTHSQYTVMVMTYGARLPALRSYVHHYSRCPSAAEVVVVWNGGGPPPRPADFPSAAAPVRVRAEAANSMNNRYRPDAALAARAVLSLDDDLRVPCADAEAAFAAWRAAGGRRLVGWFPRLAALAGEEGLGEEGLGEEEGIEALTAPGAGRNNRQLYYGEPAVWRARRYNLVLSGAAFLDARALFAAYWAPAAAAGRALVDAARNCDDLLMNYVAFNATGRGGPAVQYVRPSRRLDVSRLTGVGLSHDAAHFVADADRCLAEFGALFGRAAPLPGRGVPPRARPPACPRGSARAALDCRYWS